MSFRCADDYRSSIDMATASHKQTLLALTFRDAPLPAAYGYPVKLRVPTKQYDAMLPSWPGEGPGDVCALEGPVMARFDPV